MADNEEVYDLKLKEVPIKLKDANGIVADYYLKEIDGTARDQHMSDMANRFAIGPDGKPTSLRNMSGMYASFLQVCLFKVGIKEPLAMEFLQSIPASVQEKLYKKAQLLSGLGEEAEEVAKNA